jgi:hypothetical protein
MVPKYFNFFGSKCEEISSQAKVIIICTFVICYKIKAFIVLHHLSYHNLKVKGFSPVALCARDVEI